MTCFLVFSSACPSQDICNQEVKVCDSPRSRSVDQDYNSVNVKPTWLDSCQRARSAWSCWVIFCCTWISCWYDMV